MTASTTLEPRPAAKPLQAHTPSSQAVKDAEIAALLAKVAAQKGLSKKNWLLICSANLYLAAIDKLKKSQALKPVEKKLKEITCPLKITNLQAAMGLADDKRSYLGNNMGKPMGNPKLTHTLTQPVTQPIHCTQG
jgi:hypothetical protein